MRIKLPLRSNFPSVAALIAQLGLDYMEGMNDFSTIERLKTLKSIRIGCSSDSFLFSTSSNFLMLIVLNKT